MPLDTGILGEVARTGDVVKATNPTFAPGYHADVDGQMLGIQDQLLLAIPVFKVRDSVQVTVFFLHGDGCD